MKRLQSAVLATLFLFLGFQAKAALPPEEGMWFPLLISQNFAEMKRLGFKLTPEDIYSINNASLKDAIVSFGGFCTGEMISKDGLVLTNHHCGYGAIQANSTPQNNILQDGFVAKTRPDEKPIDDLFVQFLDRVEDKTVEVLAKVKDAESEADRSKMVREYQTKLDEEYGEGGKYIVELKEFYYGAEYFMFVYKKFTDVRLVGTPPESIGKFGGDTDNWEWPRHTGDFSLFRVYANSDNEPADYSPDNQPYQPKRHLKVSIQDLKQGDFAMIMGYPGSTERYLTSFAIQQHKDILKPSSVKVRGDLLSIMKAGMDADPKVRLQYASKYARIINYYKIFGGQIKAFTRERTIEKLQKQEAAFMAWVNGNANRKTKYGSVLADLQKVIAEQKDVALATNVLIELVRSLDDFRLTRNLRGLEALLTDYDEKSASEMQKMMVESALQALKDAMEEHFRDYNAQVSQKMLAKGLELYYRLVPAKYHATVLTEAHDKNKGDWNQYAADIHKKSSFTNRAGVQLFLQKPKLKTIQKDPLYELYNGMIQFYAENLLKEAQGFNEIEKKAARLYVMGMREMQTDRKFYPDANFTMRLTYGTVQPYEPADAVSYDYYTTMKGVVQKYIPGDEEFDLPKGILELAEKKDYGQYANKNGELPVCFLTTNDITGGNSGSPVMDGNGNLIGLAFDGNIEAAAGDYLFDSNLQRTINVDIRYVLWVIDKYLGASHIINELDLVR